MLPAERHRRIVAEIDRLKFVTTDDLTSLLGVSQETVRRDLALLERRGELARVHGGATTAQASVGEEASFSERRDAFLEEKKVIGQAAAALIEPHQTVVIDVGTTALEVARALPADHVGVIATPSLLVATEVSSRPRVEVLVSGGRLRGGDLACSNAQAVGFFNDLRADAVFLGSGGVAPYGLTDFHLDEVATKRVMLANASHRYVLADSSKFGRTASHRVCELDGFDTLITDQPCPEGLQVALVKAGGRVVVA
ncbi:DeoR/GlpR family DNA-binding transcription regulator [Streptomyces sp. LHD-70]|uniref:DeoR/GlpR family DNA-binding transcription regulator n=1 Tax=Streptomyces sp. LHD-70 TaxID=3072140 RepID=UPI00280D1869|nr:DeoR/GlpR family DNA-binding transcription regulator [Streptomyces sp. LHD-70]MDQ8708086.1 DeoR/GlpR family DNA-binding transcription regulator [Streptomyces sp. LHD-70]